MNTTLFVFAALLALFPTARAQSIGTGTGFFFSPTGHIATNFHVVEGGGTVSIRNVKGDIYDAEVIATDRANDLAVLKVAGNGFAHLPIRASTDVRKGEGVYTLGFPNVRLQGLESKLTSGMVSSLSGIMDEPNTFQISVPVQPGNSGGPLFDKTGAVVGVIVAKLSASASLKAGAGLPENVNYAVKSNYLLELLRSNRNIPNIIPTKGKSTSGEFPDLVERVEQAIVLVVNRISKANERTSQVAVDSPPRSSGEGIAKSQPPRTPFRCDYGSSCPTGQWCDDGACRLFTQHCGNDNDCSIGLSCQKGECK